MDLREESLVEKTRKNVESAQQCFAFKTTLPGRPAYSNNKNNNKNNFR